MKTHEVNVMIDDEEFIVQYTVNEESVTVEAVFALDCWGNEAGEDDTMLDHPDVIVAAVKDAEETPQ